MTSSPGPAVVETHVSVVLFTEDLAIKFKKAIRLPFLDLTRRSARLAACRAEVEVNRRLSPDVYLGVADLGLELPRGERTTAAEPLDHAVVMRRLPAERGLARLVDVGDPRLEEWLTALAARLAAFHAGAARGAHIDADATPDALARTWRRSFRAMRPFAGQILDPEALAEVERMALGYVAGRARLLATRVALGRVCDGHGDLLASDVFLLDDGPRVLDAVEFDARLRHVDVIADVAFLAMDLEYLGAGDLARRFLLRYQEAAGDVFPPTLLEHYWAQRATVRAEVACLRATQQAGSGPAVAETPPGREAVIRLEQARAHLRAGRVVLGVVAGLPGAGKTTLARAVGRRLGWTVLNSDEVRAEMVAPGRTGPLTAEAYPGAYEPAVTDQVYATLLHRAQDASGLGRPVLLDATFADPSTRRAAEDLAVRTSSELVVLTCRAPMAVAAGRAERRLAARSDLSGADAEIVEAAARRGGAAPWTGETIVDTTLPLTQQTSQACHALGFG